jgi:uncharacterized protein YbjT (DUF2867 family)
MVNVLILGANGQLARNTARLFLARTDARLTLYLRQPGASRTRIRSVLDPYRDSAEVIEASDLDYTLLRPGWFTRDEEIDYRITQKGEPFVGHDVSLNSVSDLIVKLALSPTMEVRRSLGVSRA